MKNVIVTGGAKGIGEGIVQALCGAGYKVIIADTDTAAGEKTASETGAVFVHTDVSDEKSVKACADAAGEVYALVNNAGIANPARRPLSEISLAEWQRVIDVNLTGAFLFSKYASAKMQGRGYIVNVSSTRAFQSEADTFAYSASKGGIIALTHSLAVSLGPDILVNCVSPGWINVGRYNLTEADHAQHPAGRVGKAEDIAELVLFLISGKADFITGQNFTADGGMTVKMIYEED